MPELPEVETVCRGISPILTGKKVVTLKIRQNKLRWLVPESLNELVGQTINAIQRRAKYILLITDNGTVIIHLGMSGRLSIVPRELKPTIHDHVDIIIADGNCLRLHDHRRFGAILWTRTDPYEHKLLCDLGPEPFSNNFTADYLYASSRKGKVAIKTWLMNGHVVAGIGNIYANEALHMAGILPLTIISNISKPRYQTLIHCVQEVLNAAIAQGGTTLRDFLSSSGNLGYFTQQLKVYGRGGLPCLTCGTILQTTQIQNRQTVYCYKCQK